MRLPRYISIVAAVLCWTAGRHCAAAPQDTWYAGAGAGYASAALSRADAPAAVHGPSVDVYGGRALTDLVHWDVAVQASRLGGASLYVRDPEDPGVLVAAGKLDSALRWAVISRVHYRLDAYPVSPVATVALGVLHTRWRTDTSHARTAVAVGAGVGVAWRAAPTWSVRADVVQLWPVPDTADLGRWLVATVGIVHHWRNHGPPGEPHP